MSSILNNRISIKRRQKFRNAYPNSSTAIFSFTGEVVANMEENYFWKIVWLA